MVKGQKPPEKLGPIPLNSGGSTGKQFGGQIIKGKFVPNATAEMVREQDPTGAIVAHPVRRSSYVHERLHSLSGPQKLPDELYDAAEKFRMDFERAQLSGNYAKLDLFSTRSGKTEQSDRVGESKIRISKALAALGGLKDGPSALQSCVWNVVGLGVTLDEWTSIRRANGAAMNPDKASGVLHAALECLALHYGLVDKGRLAALAQNKAYARALADFFEFAAVAFATCEGPDRSAVGRFIAAVRKRFANFS